jgi:GNAT superfamily N-acetyltransferase
MTVLYKLRDYRETGVFEREHPKELRWDEQYKLFMLEQNEQCQGIWFKDKTGLVAEVILTWQSDNVAHIESFTVLPSHRGKGLGYKIITTALDWASDVGYEYIVGEARNGASWHIFENLGASPLFLYKNWNGTKEDYMSFKLDIHNGNS